jgi:hypothetical protein
MTEINRTADVPMLVSRFTSFMRQIWPKAAIVFGLGITVAWVCLLGYGFAKLIEIAF